MNTSGMNIGMQQLLASHRGAVVKPGVAGTVSASAVSRKDTAGEVDFSQLLQLKIGEIRFSSHAATRMKSRSIEMTPELMGKLEKAVDGAAKKGARDSLIMMNDYAFIVNIPNRTVVTAMDGTNMKDTIFTNIDSAVVAD